MGALVKVYPWWEPQSLSMLELLMAVPLNYEML